MHGGFGGEVDRTDRHVYVGGKESLGMCDGLAEQQKSYKPLCHQY